MYIIYIYLTSLSTSRTLFRNACAWLKEYWQVNDQKVEMEELWDEKKIMHSSRMVVRAPMGDLRVDFNL